MKLRRGNIAPTVVNNGSSHYNVGKDKQAQKNNRTALKNSYHYDVVASREYRNVSEADTELRIKYAKSMISNVTSTDKKLIKLVKRYSTQTLTSVSEVYYIYMGGKAYGKMSIRTQYFRRGNDMYFILMHKNTSSKNRGKD